MIYTEDVHVELEHCVMWCSWHTEEDTTTSDEKKSMVKRHTSQVQNIHWTQSGIIQMMRYQQRWTF